MRKANDVQRMADGLRQLIERPAAAQALRELIDDAVEDWTEKSAAPETDEAKRQGWTGGLHALRELRDTLRDLQTDEWRKWPWIAAELQEQEEADQPPPAK